MNRDRKRRAAAGSDVEGIGRLVVDAVTGMADIVEDVHRSIAGGTSHETGGISGLVYRSIRGVTHAVGRGQRSALEKLTPLLSDAEPSPQRDTAVAVLNGVMGDHLAATANPMAIPMSLRRNGQSLVLERKALTRDLARPGGRLVVLAHGLCMDDLGWNRHGHDHGAALARDQGYTALYLRYNSGLHISTNGRAYAALLERLVHEWPVPVTELVLVGHSMGGLVSRSARYYAMGAGHAWSHRLTSCIFLGTPHQGSPLERAGNGIDLLLETSPYTAPLGRVGKLRSAGIQDLHYGCIREEDWAHRETGPPHPVPLPEGVACYAIAATLQPEPGDLGGDRPGDGLVPVASALGQHDDPARCLPFPPSRRCLCYGLNHLDLLGSHEVYGHIQRWLAGDPPPGRETDSALQQRAGNVIES